MVLLGAEVARKEQEVPPVFDVDRKMAPKADVRVEISQSSLSLSVPHNVHLMKTGQAHLSGFGFPVIMWKGTQHGGQWGDSGDVVDCLSDFRLLAEASNEDIVEFVRRYGIIQRSAEAHQCIRIGGIDLIFDPIMDGETYGNVERLQGHRAKAQKWIEDPSWLADYMAEEQRKSETNTAEGREQDEDFSEAWKNYMRATAEIIYLPDDPKTKWFFQPPEYYRYFARQANAILRIGASLSGLPEWEGTDRAPRCASPEDWQSAICPDAPETIHKGMGLDFIWSDDVALQRSCLAEWVTQTWLAGTTISPVLLWSRGEHGPSLNVRRELAIIPTATASSGAAVAPIFKLQADALVKPVSSGADDLAQIGQNLQPYSLFQKRDADRNRYHLFSLLALQIVQALASPQGIIFCDECGRVYNPLNRLPRHDQPSYCSDTCRNSVKRRTEARSRKKRSQVPAGTQGGKASSDRAN